MTAPARVLKVRDTGVSINDNPQVGLLLEVTPLTEAAFQAEGKLVVSRLNAALVQPGVAAEVKYDPRNRARLQIVGLTLSPLVSGGAAARLEELNTLRKDGLITDEEYEQKRQEMSLPRCDPPVWIPGRVRQPRKHEATKGEPRGTKGEPRVAGFPWLPFVAQWG